MDRDDDLFGPATDLVLSLSAVLLLVVFSLSMAYADVKWETFEKAELAAKLANELTFLSSRNEDLRKFAQQVSDQKRTIEVEQKEQTYMISQLTNKLDNERRDKESLAEQVKIYLQEIERLNVRSERLTAELARANSDLGSFAQLRRELHETNDARATLQKRLDGKDRDLIALRRQIDEANRKLSSAEVSARAQQKELERLARCAITPRVSEGKEKFFIEISGTDAQPIYLVTHKNFSGRQMELSALKLLLNNNIANGRKLFVNVGIGGRISGNMWNALSAELNKYDYYNDYKNAHRDCLDAR